MSATAIVAQITGSNRCDAEGLTVTGHAPVLAMCRRLIEAGYDPARPLHAYRGDTLCLKVRSIGEGAKLTVREDNREGLRLARWVPFAGAGGTSRSEEEPNKRNALHGRPQTRRTHEGNPSSGNSGIMPVSEVSGRPSPHQSPLRAAAPGPSGVRGLPANHHRTRSASKRQTASCLPVAENGRGVLDLSRQRAMARRVNGLSRRQWWCHACLHFLASALPEH